MERSMTDAHPLAYRIRRPDPLLIGCAAGEVIEHDDLVAEIAASRDSSARHAGRDLGTVVALMLIAGTLILAVWGIDQDWIRAFQAGMMLFILFGLVLLLRVILIRRQCRRDAATLLVALLAGDAVAPDDAPAPGPVDLCFLVRDAPHFPGQALREGRILSRAAFHQVLIRGCRHAAREADAVRRHAISGWSFGIIAVGCGLYAFLTSQDGGHLASATINLILGILVLLMATAQFRLARSVHRILVDDVARDSVGDEVIDRALDNGILERRWLRSPPTPFPAPSAP